MSTPERFLARTSIYCLALLFAGEAPAPTSNGDRLDRDDVAASVTARASGINYKNGKMIRLHTRVIGPLPDGLQLATAATPMPPQSWRARSTTTHWVKANGPASGTNEEATFRF